MGLLCGPKLTAPVRSGLQQVRTSPYPHLIGPVAASDLKSARVKSSQLQSRALESNKGLQEDAAIITDLRLTPSSAYNSLMYPSSFTRQEDIITSDIHAANESHDAPNVHWQGMRATWHDIKSRFQGICDKKNLLGEGNFGAVYKV